MRTRPADRLQDTAQVALEHDQHQDAVVWAILAVAEAIRELTRELHS